MSQYGSPPPEGSDRYGGSQYGDQPPPKPGTGFAVASLVTGIIALIVSITIVGGLLFGLVALVLGIVALGRAKRGGGGRGMAITGIVLGVLGALVAIGLIVAAVLFATSDAGQSLQECIDAAGTDQAAVEQCQRDLQDSLTN